MSASFFYADSERIHEDSLSRDGLYENGPAAGHRPLRTDFATLEWFVDAQYWRDALLFPQTK